MVDGYFVANYIGENEFSAVNIAMPVITSFFAIGILFSIGTQARVGFHLGRGERKRANEIFSTCFVSLVIVGIIYSIAVYFSAGKIIYMLGASELTASSVKEYLSVTAPFAVFFMTTYQLEVLVKVDGFPHISALSVFIAAVTNIVLDYVFIVPMQMGVFGAGLATGIAQVVSALLMLCHFLRGRGRINFVRRIDLSCLKKTVPLGAGDAVTEISLGYVVFLFNTTLLSIIGQEGVIIYAAISYISSFASVTMSGIAQGLAPLFSFDYGKGDYKKIRNHIAGGFIFILAISMLFIFIAAFRAEPVVDLFLESDYALKEKAILALSKYSTAYLFVGCNVLIITLFASLSKGKTAFLISLLRTPVSITIVMLICRNLAGEFIWFALTASEAVTFSIAAIVLIKYAIKPLRQRTSKKQLH